VLRLRNVGSFQKKWPLLCVHEIGR
jgi:hypothetical protein